MKTKLRRFENRMVWAVALAAIIHDSTVPIQSLSFTPRFNGSSLDPQTAESVQPLDQAVLIPLKRGANKGGGTSTGKTCATCEPPIGSSSSMVPRCGRVDL